MLYLPTHGGLFSVNHISVLFHFTLCDASFHESPDLALCVPTRCQGISEPQRPLGHPLVPPGCPQALSRLQVSLLPLGFYPQLETS